jgi:hypothetical protein
VSTRGAAVIALACAVACEGSTVNAGPKHDASAVCPATPEETVGAACALPGLRCGPQYACGILQVALLCVCTDGVFRCTDATGAMLDAAVTPACPGVSPPEACPSTERAANLAACTEQGLLCAYPSACSSSRFDQCQCFPGAMANGQFGLRFECNSAACATFDGGAVIDAAGAGDSRARLDAQVDSLADSSGDSSSEAASDGLSVSDSSDARSE